MNDCRSSQKITIGLPDRLVSYALKRFLFTLLKENPAWDIEIYIRDTDQVYKIVLNRIADMGITNGYAPFPNPSLLFLCEKDLAVMKRGSKMPDQTAVHPSMLRPQHEVYQFFSNESNDNDWHSAMAARICSRDQNQSG